MTAIEKILAEVERRYKENYDAESRMLGFNPRSDEDREIIKVIKESKHEEEELKFKKKLVAKVISGLIDDENSSNDEMITMLAGRGIHVVEEMYRQMDKKE